MPVGSGTKTDSAQPFSHRIYDRVWDFAAIRETPGERPVSAPSRSSNTFEIGFREWENLGLKRVPVRTFPFLSVRKQLTKFGHPIWNFRQLRQLNGLKSASGVSVQSDGGFEAFLSADEFSILRID